MITKAYDWVAFNARRRHDHPALTDLHSGRRFTWGQFEQRTRRASAFLARLGVKKGDRVAILAKNSTDQLDILFSAMKLGHIFLPLNWRLAVPELTYIVSDAAPRVLLYGAEFEDAARAAAKGLDCTLVAFGDGITPDEYEAGLAAAGTAWPQADLTIDDHWTILYTSGTTGRPKGSIATYGTSLWNIQSMNAFSRATADSRTLVYGPLFHTGGIAAYTLACAHLGGQILIMRQFDVPLALRNISDPDLGVTHINGAVTMYLMLSQHPDFAQADFSRIVCATISGESVPRSIIDLYLREKELPLQNIYGLTEAGPCLTAMDRDMTVKKFGSVGTCVLHTEMTLRGPDGKEVGPGEIGEIWCRGPNLSPGYWNNAEKTREAFTDGWLRTGDAARLDEDGYYWLVDRWKDMYISGGENVYPAEVENVLYRLPQIAECAVIGVAHPKWGETGRAIVVLKPGAKLGEADILAHCRESLAKFKLPTSVVYTDALPRSGGGKVVKPELRQRFGQPVEA